MDNQNKSYYLIVIAVISIFILITINKTNQFNGWKIINKNIQPNTIVFIGDSITEGADFKEAFDGAIVLNKGISGDVTEEVISRLNKDVYQFQPSKVFLLIGINDIGQNIDNDEIVNNIQKIVNSIMNNSSSSKIYLQSIYPVNDTNDKKIDRKYFKYRNNEDVVLINKSLKKFAEKENITYIDIYSKLIDKNDNLKLDYTKEGLHLNNEGYEVIFNTLRSYVYN